MTRRMTESSPSLTATWLGHNTFDARADVIMEFVARIYEQRNRFGGEVITVQKEGFERRSIIAGNRQGASVEFTLFGSPWSIGFNTIDYEGTISEDGNTISGEWSWQIFDGPFQMKRAHPNGTRGSIASQFGTGDISR